MIAVIFGKRSNDMVNTIQANSDIRELHPYDNIRLFINTCNQRGYRYERIIIRANTQNAGIDLQTLVNFLRDENMNTSVVLVYRTTVEEDSKVAKVFWSYFRSPIYTDIAITPEVQMDVELMVNLCRRSIDRLREVYSGQTEIEIKRSNYLEVEEVVVNPVGFNEGLIKEFKVGGLFRKGLNKSQVEQITRVVGEVQTLVRNKRKSSGGVK